MTTATASEPTAPRDLPLLAGAVFLSATGDFLALITLALAVHDLTGSGWAVSAYFATTMVPVVALTAVAGRIADRVESVRVMAVASLAQAGVATALAFTTGELAAILVLSTLLSAGSAISQPAKFALVPQLARDEGLTRANGVVEAARYAGFAAGPGLAALLAAAGDARVALLANAATFVAIAAAAALIRARRGPSAAPASERARSGVGFLWRDPVLRPTLIAATAALLLISASMTVEVFYMKDVLGAGDSAYALIVVVWMAAMVAGAVGLAPRVPNAALATGALVALAVQGAGMGGQTVWAVLPAAVAGNLVGGLGHGVKNTLLRTLIQRRVPDRAHGRAFAAYNAARNAAELAALAAGGVLVAAIGARPALAIAGLGPVVAGALGLAWLRRGAGPIRPALPIPATTGGSLP
jgi:MFS family permease